MRTPAPFDKVQVIERSLRCFEFGIAGLLPVIGVPFAVIAMSNFARVRRRQGTIWNPAARYLGIGSGCATAGLGVSLLVVSAIALEIWSGQVPMGQLFSNG